MNGIRNTYLYVCGSQRLLNIRRIYTSAGLIGLIVFRKIYTITYRLFKISFFNVFVKLTKAVISLVVICQILSLMMN